MTTLNLYIFLLIQLIFFSILFLVIFKKIKKLNKKPININEEEKSIYLKDLKYMQEIYFNLKDERDEFNLKLIISLIEGNVKMNSRVLSLSPIKSIYSYYNFEDSIIVCFSDYIKKELINMGYEVKFDSNNNLIISFLN